MAFTLEDGTGLTTSNAYTTTAEVDTYWKDRGGLPDAWKSLSGSGKQGMIVLASDYLDVRFRWRGIRLKHDQNMEWPRADAERDDGTLLQFIPTEVKEAVAEYAVRQAVSNLAPDPAYQDENALVTKKREKVGPIDTEYEFGAGGSIGEFRKYPIADEKLRELIIGGQNLERM